jgi:hypothetical protein
MTGGHSPARGRRSAVLPGRTADHGASRPGRLVPVLAGTAVVVGGLCVVLHLLTAVMPGHGGTLVRVVLVVMAMGCLPCVRALSRGPSDRVWAMTGLMYAGMLLAHLLLLAAAGSTMSADQMQADMGDGGGWMQVGMWGGVALAGVQVVLAVTALTINASQNAPVGARGRAVATAASTS